MEIDFGLPPNPKMFWWKREVKSGGHSLSESGCYFLKRSSIDATTTSVIFWLVRIMKSTAALASISPCLHCNHGCTHWVTFDAKGKKVKVMSKQVYPRRASKWHWSKRYLYNISALWFHWVMTQVWFLKQNTWDVCLQLTCDCLGKRLLYFSLCTTFVFNHGMHEDAGLSVGNWNKASVQQSVLQIPIQYLILIPPEMSVCLKPWTFFVLFYLPLYHPIKSLLNLIFPSPVFRFLWCLCLSFSRFQIPVKVSHFYCLFFFCVFTVLLSRLTYALLSVTLQQVRNVSARSASDCEEKASSPPRVLPQ